MASSLTPEENSLTTGLAEVTIMNSSGCTDPAQKEPSPSSSYVDEVADVAGNKSVQVGVGTSSSSRALAAAAPVSLSSILQRSTGSGCSGSSGAFPSLSQAPSVERAPGHHHHHLLQPSSPTKTMGHGASCLTGNSILNQDLPRQTFLKSERI